MERDKKKRPWWKRGLRILWRIILILLILLLLLVLFVRSQWGQEIIVGKLTTYVSEKTNTKVTIDKLYITFSGDLDLQGLYLEDKKGDTLIYSEKLQVAIPLWPIIRGNPISIDGLEWTGLRANIIREDSLDGFNFQFLIDAFASDSTHTNIDTTASEPPKIAIGTIDLSNFNIKFDDAVTGMNADLDLGALYLKGKNFDLQQMKFELADLVLENTQLNYVQSKPSPPSDTTESTLPYLSLNNLLIKNVHLNYKAIPDSLIADLNVAELALKVAKADLANQAIDVGDFVLSNSNISYQSNKQQPSVDTLKKANKTDEEIEFIWPDWNVTVASIVLQNNNLRYQAGEKSTNQNVFDPNFIDLANFNFKAKDIGLTSHETANISLENFSFIEQNSGLNLKNLAFSIALDPSKLAINNFDFSLGNSSIHTNLKAEFSSLKSFINQPELSILTIDLKQFVIDLNDAFLIQSDLVENEYLQKLAKHKITGQIKADGTLATVNISEFLVNWGHNTMISTYGKLENLTDFEDFTAAIDNFTFNSTRTDLRNFVSEADLGISIPRTVQLQTKLNGKLDDLAANLLLTIPVGKIKVDGNFKHKNNIQFAAKMNVIDFNLGKILNDTAIGTIAFEMIASGEGKNINDLNAKLVSNFSKLEYNGYNFSALQLDGKLNSGNGDIAVVYNDENLDLLVNSKIQLDSIAPKIDIDFKMEGADLYAMGFTEKQIKAKLIMTANFKGNSAAFDFESHITEGIAVYDENTYKLGTFDISANVTADSTALDIKSDFLTGMLNANSGIEGISSAIQQHLEGYFSDSLAYNDSISDPVQLKMKMKISESKLITDFLLPDMRMMDTLNLEIDFNQEQHKFTANLNLPYLDYAEKTLDSLQLIFNSTENEADFKFGFAQLNADPFVMNRTFFDGDLKKGNLNLNFSSFNGQEEIYAMQSVITGNISDLTVHIQPEKLIAQGEQWTIPANNQLRIHNKTITAQDFILSKNGESIAIANDYLETAQNNIGIGFTNFKLANILALFNKDELLAAGNLQGQIVAIDPFENLGLKANFSIENLIALEAPLGILSLNATSTNDNKYNLDLTVKGNDVDLAVNGDYSIQNIGSELDFNLKMNKISMETIATISGENLNDASGNISGEFSIKGETTAPEYKGYLQFNDAAFNVTQVNSKFRLANNKIDVNNTKITLNEFTIEDETNNVLTLSGNIFTEDLSDPSFDLSVNGKNFQALNSTVKDNELFYGKVNFDLTGTIKGKLSFPDVDLNLDINENTNFTYVVQDAQAQIETRDGIVEFVNKENPDDILTRNVGEEDIAVFGGIELKAKINIDENAEFNVIIDPKTGDNLNVSGVAALDFNIAKNGQMNLSGSYEINKGHYDLSLYNLVKRKFEFEPGSSITWHGDPMDADLNVTAKYALETSASALMASQTSGASEEVSNQYRQKLPFEVFLNVKGELDQPKLDFRLDMPEDSRGAIDGTVYSQIKQLNNEEDELNKQVFSLLVLKKFYPNAGSDGSDGGAASLVRKNINDALSDQLNAFSDKLTGNTGIELDFGLNSYTDYQGESAEQRTDLNISAQKKLLDDRLIVQVGSDVNVEGTADENPIVGNASIQYLLTEDGRWRLTGFRSSEYENVIDGQIYVNGISLIFQRQFNKWNELFDAPPTVSEKDENVGSKKELDNQDNDPEKDKKSNN